MSAAISCICSSGGTNPQKLDLAESESPAIFSEIRANLNPKLKKKDLRFYEQRFVLKIWYFTKYKWQKKFKTAKFHLLIIP
jgi:hypothetical protein